VAADGIGEFGAVEQVALSDGDAVAEGLERLG
jgi:hypothetical protein